MKFIKQNYKYLIIFIVCVIFNFIFIGRFYDGITQYGMARAISNGEIPYKDFNTVTTPLFIFIHSIFLLFYDSYITYVIINSLIFTLMCYFIDKIIPNHFITFVLLMLLPFCDVICPSYNLLSKLLLVFLIYLEKSKKSDYLIGISLGLLILAKHSVGLCVLLCSLLYVKKWSKIKDRLIGLVIPCSIFLLYLLFTNSLYNFIDLTFLGLFDFGNKNSIKNPMLVGASILFLIYYCFILFKYKNDDNYLVYYAIGSLSFIIPICDINHFTGVFICFLLIIFTRYEIRLYYTALNLVLTCLVISFSIILFLQLYRPYKVLSYNHIPIFFRSFRDDIDKVLYYYGEKYPNSVMFGYRSDFYDVILDKKYTYFDVPLKGNFGHLGTEKIASLLENDKYYFINKDCNNLGVTQYDVETCKFIKSRSKFIETFDNYDIYYYNDNSR